MTTLRTAAQQALEAMTSRDGDSWTRRFARDRAIEALEAALAEPTTEESLEIEPVAWMHTDAYNPKNRHLEWSENRRGYLGDWIKTPLYAAPLQRTPLTEERNFCPRCGKRTNDIHTCTPPQEDHFCDTHCTWADHAPGCVRAEPVQEPYTSERHFALREVYCIAAADAFWKARPGTKDDGRAIAFDAGFARGFDKGTNLAEKRHAALSEPVQEPVAWLVTDCIGERDLCFSPPLDNDQALPLYAAPPQRKPLTDDEIHDCWQQRHRDKTTERRLITRAIERAHGIV